MSVGNLVVYMGLVSQMCIVPLYGPFSLLRENYCERFKILYI